MKKKSLFLLLTVLWVANAIAGGAALYLDFAKGAVLSEDPAVLAHLLYMVTALLAAGLTFYQYRRHRTQ